MKKLLSFLFFLAVHFSIYSQNCYNELSKFDGIDNSENLIALNETACELRKALPNRFENNFAVFSYEFYSLTESFEESYPEQFKEVINYIKSQKDYYLIIGKENNSKGLISNFYININLPTSDSLDCLNTKMMDYISTLVLSKIENKYKEMGSIYPLYYQAEIEGMNFLKNYIIDKIGCCLSPLREGYCSVCLDESDMTKYLQNKQFDICSSFSINATAKLDTSSSFKEYAEITVTTNTESYSLNSKIENILKKMGSICPNTGGEIQYYFNDTSCLNILDLASTEIVNDKSKNYFYIKAIAYKSESVGPNIAIKVETNLNKQVGKGNGTLYFINLDPKFNTDGIIDSTMIFFDLADLHINTKKVKKTEILKIGNSDALVVIGKDKADAYNFMFYSYLCEILGESLNGAHGIGDWYEIDNKMSPERSKNLAIAISTDDLSTFYTNWDNVEKTNRLENNPNRLIAFIILHGTSHLAGLRHRAEGQTMMFKPEGRGYADKASKISDMIKDDKMNFESIIDTTKNKYPLMISLTNERFKK